MSRMNGMGGALLLALLALCAWSGKAPQEAKTVSGTVRRTSYVIEENPPADACNADAGEWDAAGNELLTAIAAHQDADAKTKEQALAQMAKNEKYKAQQSKIRACLEAIGIEGAVVICDEDMATVIAPEDKLHDEQSRMRVFDAVAGVSGYEAGDIKIIITKK